MPHLQDLWSEVSKQRNDVAFLCINMGDEEKVIRNYWSENKFQLTALQQNQGAASQAFGVMAYPTNYLIGPDGKVLWRGVGYDEATLRSFLQQKGLPREL